MTKIFVDADACPVKDEIERVADRHGVETILVTDGGLRPPRNPNVRLMIVAQGADAADDWIADNISSADVCVTNDIPLAARCLEKQAAAIRPNGDKFSQSNIGAALATRDLMQTLRETGEITGGPKPFSNADRSNFLNAFETTVSTALKNS